MSKFFWGCVVTGALGLIAIAVLLKIAHANDLRRQEKIKQHHLMYRELVDKHGWHYGPRGLPYPPAPEPPTVERQE